MANKQQELAGTHLPIRSKNESILSGFHWAVLSHPHSTAITDAKDGSTLTYLQLQNKVSRYAKIIYDLLKDESVRNVDGDALVAICVEPSTDFIVLILAIMELGAAYVALDVTYPAERIEFILEDCQPLLFISQIEITDRSSSLTKCIKMNDLKLEVSKDCDVSELSSVKPVGGESVGIVLYTSGSTGVPKGVRIPHRALLNRLAWQWDHFPYQEEEVCCFKTSCTFVDSLSEIFGPLLTGRSLLVIPKAMLRVDTLVELLDAHRIGRLVLVPTLLRSILLHCRQLPQEKRLQHLRLWVCSGETLPASLLEDFFKVFTDGQTICNFYGSTEVLGDVTFIQFRNQEDVRNYVIGGNVPIGAVVSNNTIYLEPNTVSPGSESSEEGNFVAGEPSVGELCVHGDNLTLGYVRIGDSDRFIRCQISGKEVMVYRTGDYGRLIGSNFYFEGRKDSQIKIRGHRVDCAEVQQTIANLEGISDCIVLVHKPATVQQKLVAFYCCESDSEKAKEEIVHSEVSVRLPSYMVPEVVRLSSFPLLVNGKVDRQQLLRSLEGVRGVAENEVNQDSTDTTVSNAVLSVAQAVVGVLPSKKVSLHDSFFSIGGNSLNVVMMVTGLLDLGYEIGLSEFLECSSLSEVVRVILGKSTETEGETEDTGATYTCHLIEHSDKEVVATMMGKSFATKSILEVTVGVTEVEMVDLVRSLWDEAVRANLRIMYHPLAVFDSLYSFTVKDSKGDCVAAAINFDLYEEPPLEIEPPMTYVFDFLEDVESKVRHLLPTEVGEVIHSFTMATEDTMTTKENMELIHIMERFNLKLAKERGYKAVFTTNTSDATRLVCCDLLQYKILSEVPMFSYTAKDGSRPFAEIPRTEIASAAARYV